MKKPSQPLECLPKGPRLPNLIGVRVGDAVRLTGSSTGGRAELRRAASVAFGFLGLLLADPIVAAIKTALEDLSRRKGGAASAAGHKK